MSGELGHRIAAFATSPLVAARGPTHQIGFIGKVVGRLKVEIVCRLDRQCGSNQGSVRTSQVKVPTGQLAG